MPHRNAPGCRSVRFLLVEDNDLVARMYGRELARHGAVDIAPSVATAMRYLLAPELTGLVTDIALPDGSGFDVARAAREQSPSMPILIVSGVVDSNRLDLADRLRAIYLQKPIGPEQLARFAERAIDRQHRDEVLLDVWLKRYGLSSAEVTTLRLALDGRSRDEIATARGVSPNTVKMQIGSLLAKVGERSIARAVSAFLRELAELG